MGVYKKDNRWYIDYYLPNGKRKREAVSIEGVDPSKINREDSNKALSIRKAEIAQGKFDIQKLEKPLPFEHLASMYLEWAKDNHIAFEREETAVNALLSYFKGKNSNTVTLWHTEQYKSKRKAKGRMPSTINKELGVLRLMYNVAVSGKLKWKLNKNPIQGIKLLKIPNKKNRVLKDWEFQKLYAACSVQLKLIVLCAYSTGMRRSEISNLKWDNVDLRTKYINLEETKNNESRSIPINKILFEHLVKRQDDSTSEYVFTRPDGQPYSARTSWRYLWLKALKESGIAKLRFHDLRHTFISNLIVDEKEDFATVMSLSGHKDIRMLKHYSHTHEDAKKTAVEKLAERIKLSTMDTYLDTSDKNAIKLA